MITNIIELRTVSDTKIYIGKKQGIYKLKFNLVFVCFNA